MSTRIMECNKDEALRAMKVAESKMQKGDFEGGLKFAMKAKKMYTEVDNIAQILTVCEVHTAAQNKLSSSDNDWYRILQIAQLADEAAIKKQYRKLALLLHPDKNKFSGAEAAFKLIGEANRVLGDRSNRSMYDMKYRVSVRPAGFAPKTSSHHSNGNAFASKHDPPKPAPESNGGIPFGAERAGNFVPSVPVTVKKCAAAGAGGHPKGKKMDAGFVATSRAKGTVPASKETKATESRTPTNVGSKRVRQSAPDLGESFDAAGVGNDTKGDKVEENGVDPSRLNARRSSRKKPQVSYAEIPEDDGNQSPLKMPRQNNLSETDEFEESKEPASGGVSISPEEASLHNKSEIDMSEEDNCSPKNSDASSDTEEEITCPDAEFNDFEKDKAEGCFAVNQFWATYDPDDAMPRFYALIKKVSSPFKLEFTWLEADPDSVGEIDWRDADLPIACGKFRLGDTQSTSELSMFSHQIHCVKGTGRRSYLVYPQKGETWAIFRDWDIKWSSNSDEHLEYEYEYVEILSDFAESVGVEIAYLVKVEGFVSLFQRTEKNGTNMSCVLPTELYRFSHRIPSYKMTGYERKGVPKGSFELDPAALPIKLFEVGDHGNSKMEN